MGHYSDNEESLTSIDYSRNQAILIARNVEDCVPTYQVGRRIHLFQLGEILPTSFLCYLEESSQ
jgi:hypothetical protein